MFLQSWAFWCKIDFVKDVNTKLNFKDSLICQRSNIQTFVPGTFVNKMYPYLIPKNIKDKENI